jgi:hypothetical protein
VVLGLAAYGVRNYLNRPDRGPQGRAGSVALSTTAPLAKERPPQAYEVEYRVEESATDRVVVNTQKVSVRRPFDARGEIRDSKGEVLEQRLTVFGKLTIGTKGNRRLLGVPPALASADLRPDVVLPEAVTRGLLKPREQRRVAGRVCQVYRAAKTVSSGELVPLDKAKASEHADVCIDAAGLLLEEVWQNPEGRRLTRRVATRVDVAPSFDEKTFSVEGIPDLPVTEGGGGVRPVDDGRPLPSGVFLLDQVPEGFTMQGRYAVIQPKLDVMQDPLGASETPRSTSFTDVWVRGPDVLVLDRGDAAAFSAHPYGRTIDLGPLGQGETYVDLRTSEARATVRNGYVRLYGTLPTDELVALARKLRPTT